MGSLRHAKTSGKSDGADSSVVQPSDWNADHALTVGGMAAIHGGLLFCQTATKTHGNSATEATLANTGVGSLSLPAGFFAAGRVLRIRAGGFISTLASSPGNFTLRLYAGSTVLLQTTSAGLVVNTTTRRWSLDATVICHSAGASGKFWGEGRFETSNNSETASLCYPLKRTTAGTFDTTQALTLNLTAQWATANASNTITCTVLTVEAY